MSFKSGNILSLIGADFSGKSDHDLRSVFTKFLNEGTHGICFSPYLEGQKPGSIITEEQIRKRLEIIRPYTNWVRIFSCTEHYVPVAKVISYVQMIKKETKQPVTFCENYVPWYDKLKLLADELGNQFQRTWN